MLASGSILLAVTFVALDCLSPLDSECDKGNDRDWLIAMLEHSRVKSVYMRWSLRHGYFLFVFSLYKVLSLKFPGSCSMYTLGSATFFWPPLISYYLLKGDPIYLAVKAGLCLQKLV